MKDYNVNEKVLFSTICAVCLIIIAGCSKKSGAKAAVPYNSKKAYGVNTSVKLEGRGFSAVDDSNFDSYEMADVLYEEEAAAPREVQVGQDASYERKLIRTGNVTLEVQSVSGAEDEIAKWANSLGGYVTNANTWQYGANFTVRIPSARFDDAMTQVGNFGRITNRNISSEDVSENYYDLQSRLETKYILRDKLSSYLNQAKDIKDLLEIERQLNSVIEDIESTEGRFKRLSGQIDYSTIYINMQFERGKDEGGIILPDVKDSWNEFISNVVGFFWGLLKVIFYIIIFGIPVVGLGAFFFWLLFGKVGLLVKLFKKLKK